MPKTRLMALFQTYEQIECALNEPPMRIVPAGVEKHTSYGLTPGGWCTMGSLRRTGLGKIRRGG